MIFIEDHLCQKNKRRHNVCGDVCRSARTPQGTVFVVCDGIGSGIYANISAITCASRIMELFRSGLSLRVTSETVAASMHRARTEDIPFSAFSAAVILPDGQFAAYAYEAPNPILIQNSLAGVLEPRFYTAGFEVIGEVSGMLHTGDSLLLFSDGVSQAGLGHGYSFGIGSEGVSDFINRSRTPGGDIQALPEQIMEMCKSVSGGAYEDDTTLALLHCRVAKELTVLTGPPARQTMDHGYAADFAAMPGLKAVCGSTTASVIARELGRKVETIAVGASFGMPPEYGIDGIDLVAEGAVTLTQVYNILDVPVENLTENSVVERLCMMLLDADVIYLMIGNATNAAHEDLLFKQVGVHVRKTAVKMISEKLRSKGKLVIEKSY